MPLSPYALVGSLLAVLAVVFSVGLLFGRLLRRPASSFRVEVPNRPAIRFGPMERLLSQHDVDFVRSAKGFRPEIEKQLRSSRLRVFRSYLAHLDTEFSRLHRTLRLLTLVAGEDRPEVSRILLEQKLLFTMRLAGIRFRLAFYHFGVRPTSVSGLVAAVESLREQVRLMQEPAQIRVPVAL